MNHRQVTIFPSFLYSASTSPQRNHRSSDLRNLLLVLPKLLQHQFGATLSIFYLFHINLSCKKNVYDVILGFATVEWAAKFRL